jgi:hypothetical protein
MTRASTAESGRFGTYEMICCRSTGSRRSPIPISCLLESMRIVAISPPRTLFAVPR